MRALSDTHCGHFQTKRSLMLSAAQDKTTATSGTSSEPPRSPDPRSTCDADGWLPKPRHDRRPKVPAHRLRAYQPAHPVKLSRMARKRAQQRWSALLKRIADKVRAMLGDALWADFVAHANACYKDALLSAFRKPILRCVAPQHGGVCPHNFHVDLTCARAYATLGELHLDHEQDLVRVAAKPEEREVGGEVQGAARCWASTHHRIRSPRAMTQ